eukprot:gi/632975457/ref/XP_007904239.1/ PREDICTED: neurexin-3b-like [Callorhinchus milii]
MDSVCLVLLFASLAGLSLGVEFTGSPGQWARYSRWEAGSDRAGDLSFRFRTDLAAALLLYLDDGGYCDFLQVSLAGGRLRLRFSVDCYEAGSELGAGLNDSRWHAVTLSARGLRAVVTLDGEARAAEVRPRRQHMRIVSDLFVGGIPGDIRRTALTCPSAQEEPPFRGRLEQLRYGASAPAMLGSRHVLLPQEGSCADDNPCEHDGSCSLVEGATTCDCTNTGYTGRYCSEGKVVLALMKALECKVTEFIGLDASPDTRALRALSCPIQSMPDQVHFPKRTTPIKASPREDNSATFRGSEYLCYDLSQNPIQSSSDEITLSFKTWQRNGLILHTGKSADYVNLALKDGAVSLVINLGSGAFEALVEPVNGKFNDNAWHEVKVTRNLRQAEFGGKS